MKILFVIFILSLSVSDINKSQTIFTPELIFYQEINFGGDIDKIYSALQANNGYVVAGQRYLKNGQTYDQFTQICKFDQYSNLEWEYTGDINSCAWWQSLALAPDGIFIGESGENVFITKINNQGNLVWKKSIGSNASPVIVSNDNIVVAVLSQHSYCPIKILNLEANELNSWGVALDICYGIILKENNLYIFGDNPGGVQTNLHSEIIKTDLEGNIIWQDTLMDVHGLRGAIDINGDLYVSGFYFPNAQSWYRTIKYDLDGNRIWEKFYNGDLVAPYNLSNYVNSVIPHPNGGCTVVGDLVKINGGDPNMLDGGAISYSPNGDTYFKIRYDANPLWYRTTHEASFFCPNDNCLMIFGTTWDLNPDTAQVLFATKWDNVTGVADEDKTLPVDISLSQNYPNPFNPRTSIQYAISNRQFVSIKVYDLLGREIVTLVNEEKPAGEYEVEFNASNLSSGIYFYRLRATPSGGQAGQYVETKKMVLIR